MEIRIEKRGAFLSICNTSSWRRLQQYKVQTDINFSTAKNAGLNRESSHTATTRTLGKKIKISNKAQQLLVSRKPIRPASAPHPASPSPAPHRPHRPGRFSAEILERSDRITRVRGGTDARHNKKTDGISRRTQHHRQQQGRPGHKRLPALFCRQLVCPRKHTVPNDTRPAGQVRLVTGSPRPKSRSATSLVAAASFFEPTAFRIAALFFDMAVLKHDKYRETGINVSAFEYASTRCGVVGSSRCTAWQSEGHPCSR